MLRRIRAYWGITLACIVLSLSFVLAGNSGCATPANNPTHGGIINGKPGCVKLITLNPGHFHASLVQKQMLREISPVVHVYAPAGPDLQNYLTTIKGFNTRKVNPTHWKEKVYTGPDYLVKMLAQKPGNVVVIAGNNREKTHYIKVCLDDSLNVLADKPMCIDTKGFDLLEKAFDTAKKNHVLLYDIMTERSEITTILQKALMHTPSVFGQLQKGTPQDPAVIMESVHHFFKYVAGNPIKRPAWFFDTNQEGEGIVDVSTHLVDLAMWICFPSEAINYKKDINVYNARHWPTMLTLKQFQKVTRLKNFPEFLRKKLNSAGNLPCYCNGEIDYTLKGVNVKVQVEWKFQSKSKVKGPGDTHFSMIRGSNANIIIRQGAEQNYIPELYVEPAGNTTLQQLEKPLRRAVAQLNRTYPGLTLQAQPGRWHITVPDKYRLGHEAHFHQVMERYLGYLREGRLPTWELSNMIAKYYTTTKALQIARQK